MENIVITGATGFLGSHLAQWFLEQGDLCPGAAGIG